MAYEITVMEPGKWKQEREIMVMEPGKWKQEGEIVAMHGYKKMNARVHRI